MQNIIALLSADIRKKNDGKNGVDILAPKL